jgi:Asp-tRNA(Asn)/Glu-tRNA(Gln) amidotransferase A subunit family amidase
MITPWMDDACSLVDAFRAKELSPLEALDACIDAIEKSPLNVTSHTDYDRARQAARRPMWRCRSGAFLSASRNWSGSKTGRTPMPP